MNSRDYRSSIPPNATPRVEERFDNGRMKSAFYYLDGEKVGYRAWDETGELDLEYGMKNGKKHGREYNFLPAGCLLEVTPYRNGRLHGVGKQWDEDGTVLITYKLNHGAGLDLWCGNCNDTLAEEQYWPKKGELGYRRNWNDDESTIFEEYFFLSGKGYHGIWRKWGPRGGLKRGYPRFYVADNRVSLARYKKECLVDAILPKYRKADDRPFRKLPSQYVLQRK